MKNRIQSFKHARQQSTISVGQSLCLVATALCSQVAGAPTYSNPLPFTYPSGTGLSDPAVFEWQGRYWIAPNSASNSIHLYSSTDLVTWTWQGEKFFSTAFCSGGNPWKNWVGMPTGALYRDGDFYFYYQAAYYPPDFDSCYAFEDAEDEIEGDPPCDPEPFSFIGVARAEFSPSSSWEDLTPCMPLPLISDNTASPEVFDPYIFEDEDGSLYLFYVRRQAGGGWTGYEVAVQRMIDPVTIDSSFAPVSCVNSGTVADIREAPTVFKEGGSYYMLYSSGYATQPDYKVHFAYSRVCLRKFWTV